MWTISFFVLSLFSPQLSTFIFDNCKDDSRMWERSIYYWKQEKNKVYGVRASRTFQVLDVPNTHVQIMSDERRSKCEWSNCILWISFILIPGSPNECWLHTCDACVIITWRLKLQATLVARNKVVNNSPLHKSKKQDLLDHALKVAVSVSCFIFAVGWLNN